MDRKRLSLLLRFSALTLVEEGDSAGAVERRVGLSLAGSTPDRMAVAVVLVAGWASTGVVGVSSSKEGRRWWRAVEVVGMRRGRVTAAGVGEASGEGAGGDASMALWSTVVAW